MELNNIRAWDKEKLIFCEEVIGIDFRLGQIQLHKIGHGSYCQLLENVLIIKQADVKDKNGREVYEGVIIKYKDTKGVVKFGKYKNPSDDDNGGHVGFFVEFEDETVKSMYRKDLIFWLNVSEAIGDIYKNPELLSPT